MTDVHRISQKAKHYRHQRGQRVDRPVTRRSNGRIAASPQPIATCLGNRQWRLCSCNRVRVTGRKNVHLHFTHYLIALETFSFHSCGNWYKLSYQRTDHSRSGQQIQDLHLLIQIQFSERSHHMWRSLIVAHLHVTFILQHKITSSFVA